MVNLIAKRPQEFSIWDAFCGSGGTTAGALRVPGAHVSVALNHDPVAISSHAANFPGTFHDRVDITQCDVSKYLDISLPFIFWGSPECKYQGYCSGVSNPKMQLSLFEDDIENPAHAQSRLTMNQIIRFAQESQDRGYIIPYICVENVPELVLWHKFHEWESRLKSLGYLLQFVNLNARFLGVPQSRDRLFIVCSHKNYPTPDMRFEPIAHCESCGSVRAKQTWKRPGVRSGRYGSQYFYSCPSCLNAVMPPSLSAASFIDFSNKGTRIGDRSKPLTAATINRIKQGFRKFVLPGLCATSFIAEMRGNSTVRCIEQPLSTVSTSGAHHQLVTPGFTLQYYSRNNASTSLCDPLPTVPCDNRHAIVSLPFLMSYYTNGNVYSPHEPLRTVCCNDRFSLISPEAHLTSVEDIDIDEMINDAHTRMLTLRELSHAQGFPDGYIFLGTDKQKKRQIGNAVPPSLAHWITDKIRQAVG